MIKMIIRPISELSKRMADVEAFVIGQDTPVHLTKNGYNHMVIMSSNHYEKISAKINMYENLLRSEAEIRQGKSLRLDSAMTDIDQYLQERIHKQYGK
ncbi:type II toxin-antitoxin system Phd/YefM family antitoxin [Pelosinus propionicus]|uniref:Antitoxin n=1 Tax=Pelosinus propionicus DSM 13327 TaxID=1123291 RepID=A0A1I4PG71_9FIRM|nr:type II toxin-antitoxin system Phd/YefM family antitoxin [Pelosinus propionicus]SFM26575.1 Antitoxin Phd_YefM, type II toxin-antitoxin system [Pelosinus propionicus DSM 13327]